MIQFGVEISYNGWFYRVDITNEEGDILWWHEVPTRYTIWDILDWTSKIMLKPLEVSST